MSFLKSVQRLYDVIANTKLIVTEEYRQETDSDEQEETGEKVAEAQSLAELARILKQKYPGCRFKQGGGGEFAAFDDDVFYRLSLRDDEADDIQGIMEKLVSMLPH